jgi:hypothetical protein
MVWVMNLDRQSVSNAYNSDDVGTLFSTVLPKDLMDREIARGQVVKNRHQWKENCSALILSRFWQCNAETMPFDAWEVVRCPVEGNREEPIKCSSVVCLCQ